MGGKMRRARGLFNNFAPLAGRRARRGPPLSDNLAALLPDFGARGHLPPIASGLDTPKPGQTPETTDGKDRPMIRKTLIASTLAGALAVTPLGATPASAAPDAQDIALTLLGLAVIGAVANDMKNDRGEVSRSSGSRNDDRYWDNGRRDDRRRLERLPARCEIEVRTRRGWTEAFGERCLEREGIRVNRLPNRCEFQARTARGRATVYGSECLQDAGYRVEAQRRHDRR